MKNITKIPNYLSNEDVNSDINDEFQYLISSIKEHGYESAPRGQKVKEIYMYCMPLDPTKVLIDFKERPFNWRYFAGELAWYLKKERTINYISNFSKFWKQLTDNEGNINSNYGDLLFGDQLHWCLTSLQKDKNTRQAIAFLNQPKFQYEGNKDFVCTMYLNFFIRENTLHMKMTIRSNDMFFGLSYDAPFFSLILQQMRLWLLPTYPELKLGTYFHYADNIHYYERHFSIADKIELEENVKSPDFELNNNLFDFDKNKNIIFSSATKKFLNDIDYLIDKKAENEQYKNILYTLLGNKDNINIIK